MHRAIFIVFWLWRFIFCEYLHYFVKLYFRLVNKILTGVSLSLAPLFSSQLCTQLNILCKDEIEGKSYHIVTSSVHYAILQTLLWEHFFKYLEKCKKPRHIKKNFKAALL